MTDHIALQAQLDAANERETILRARFGDALRRLGLEPDAIERFLTGDEIESDFLTRADFEALRRSHLDSGKVSVNTPDMPHEPCNEVQQLADDLREVRGESRGTSVSLATIVGKLDMLLWAIGGVGAVMLGVLSWMFLRVDSHETRITQCCIDAHRLEAFESRLSETVAQLRSAQPSTVAKSP